MTATFWTWDDIDGRWHQLRTWDPDAGTWILWCRPRLPHRLPDDAITTEPGQPQCRDCATAQVTNLTARIELEAARARLAEIRKVHARR